MLTPAVLFLDTNGCLRITAASIKAKVEKGVAMDPPSKTVLVIPKEYRQSRNRSAVLIKINGIYIPMRAGRLLIP